MIAAQVPVLSSKGEAGKRRSAFSEEEYEAVLDAILEENLMPIVKKLVRSVSYFMIIVK